MKSIPLLVVIGLVGLVAITQATDYCSKTLCGKRKHIGCNNSGKFASTCPAGKKEVKITADHKNAIVKRHNTLRNKLAIGKLAKFKPSKRMATMKWDNELASLALLNVKTCKFEHDACHNTDKYKEAGQNLAETWSSAPFGSSIQAISLPLIDSWWLENENATMTDINKYPANPKDVIGHFTEMAIEGNYAIGCAAASFKDPNMNGWNAFLFACNYAKINMIGDKIYTSGKTASQCKTGVNPQYKGLCSTKENY